MSLHYVIDGYNLLRHNLYRPGCKISDERLGLLDFIRKEKLCGSLKNKVTVVFDGFPGNLNIRGGDIEVIFSQEESADDKIKKIIHKRCDVKSIVVVSDDREVKDFVKLQGVKASGIEEFIQPKRKHRSCREIESLKPELTYSLMHKINQELRQLWLK
jgi:predicted RNA-binding protein with PIN domain